jgi:hypothetical protein
LREIADGIWHWTAFRETIGLDVSSYWIEPARAVIDPMVPPDAGLDWWEERGVRPECMVLTIGLHYRQADRFAERFGCPVLVARAAQHRFEGDDREVRMFDFGDEVAPGITAIEVDAIAPDETALHISHGGGAVAIADGVVRMGAGGQLSFVPDFLMGDDAAQVKDGLLSAFRGLLELDFETLLLAHGDPIAGHGKEALREFVASPVEMTDFDLPS